MFRVDNGGDGENGMVTRVDAFLRCLRSLRFLWQWRSTFSEQNTEGWETEIRATVRPPFLHVVFFVIFVACDLRFPPWLFVVQ